MKNSPYISILTPSFNRVKFLPTLIQSLQDQTFKNFEWVIGNDGSSDGTEEYLLDQCQKLDFSITYISSDLRIGKSSVDNQLLDHAKGKYFIWCDSDDFLLKNSLEEIVKIIQENQIDSADSIAGVIGQNFCTEGISQTFDVNTSLPDSGIYSWKNLEPILIGDGTICVKRDVYRHQRFPEIDFLTIESIILRDLFEPFNFYLSDTVLKIMDRSAENSVSHGNKLQYCRGSAYSINATITPPRFKEMTVRMKILTVISYFRYCIHGDIAFKDSVRMWKLLQKNYTYTFLYLVSYAISIRDVYLKKVEKTHIEFERNRTIAKISVKYFNQNNSRI